MRTKNIVSNELADAIDIPLDMSGKVACDNPHADGRSCIDHEIRIVRGKSKGWHGVDARKLCASCACHWHLSCARNFALGVVR